MDATRILESHAAGKRSEVNHLVVKVYRELHRLAGHYLRPERADHTLQPTALVHEAYMRLVDDSRISWEGKTHFFALAAREMRRVLVESARAHGARKRGGRLARVTLDERLATTPEASIDVLTLHEAIDRLAQLSPRQARILELRFFGGLSIAETAFALGISQGTVKQDWRVARAWLHRELTPRAVD